MARTGDAGVVTGARAAWSAHLVEHACLGVMVLFVGGCGSHQCTAMGCSEGVTLELASPFVEVGEYAFAMTTGTATFTCTAFVPLRRDGSEPLCESLLVNRQEITTRTGDALSGRAGDDIVSVWIAGHHDSLTLTVTRDGSEILRAEVVPDYRGVEINGEGCGECPMATHTVGG